jgi:uncharacterized membrane protein YecN with MAPEG domain
MNAITPIYAGLMGLFYVFLSFRVAGYRKDHRISMGDGEDKALLKRVRTQANCGEYIPISLILLLMTELQGAPELVVHGLGVTMVLGRVLHAYGFGSHPQKIGLRVTGMILTFAMIALASLANIGHAFY